MSHLYCSFVSVCAALIVFHVSFLHSSPMHSNFNSHLYHDDIPRAPELLLSSMRIILDESNSYEQLLMINQLREYLNRMCIAGYFGSSHAQACRHIVETIHPSSRSTNHEDSAPPTTDSTNDEHGLQKRFFCNGFIGCKSSGR